MPHLTYLGQIAIRQLLKVIFEATCINDLLIVVGVVFETESDVGSDISTHYQGCLFSKTYRP